MARKPIAEQVIVVTGGSAELGRAVARRPGDRGARGRFSDGPSKSTLWTSLRLRRLLLGATVAGVGLATMAAHELPRNRFVR